MPLWPRGSGWLGDAGLGADPAGDVVQGGELAQLEGVVAFEVPVGADGGEDLGLLDGVDAEVGLEVEIGVEQVGGVAGHLGDDAGDDVEDRVARRSARRRERASRPRQRVPVPVRRGVADGSGTPVLVADPAGDVVQGRELAQLEGVVALEVPAGRGPRRRPRPA